MRRVPIDHTLTQWPAWLLLAGVGAVASAINAVAGGGTFVSFPVLVALGLPPVSANATNASGLWVGSLSGAIGYLKLLPATAAELRALALPTALGSVAGALLLVGLSQRVFDFVIPVLIFSASAVIANQRRIRAWVDRRHGALPLRSGVLMQFLVAVYGGYFGAGMGFMMLAAFALFIDASIHELNALKTWLGMIINLTATVLLLLKGQVVVTAAIALGLGSIVGGFAAARLSPRIQPDQLRKAVALYGFGTAAYFAYRALV
jgi:uncharacterized membrane protein YfcA